MTILRYSIYLRTIVDCPSTEPALKWVIGMVETLDRLKKWAEVFWFIRGVMAAFLLMTLVPELTSLSKYQFLRAFHAAIIGWNQIASAIGECVGFLPFLPKLDNKTINTILFAASFGVPSAIAVLLHSPAHTLWMKRKIEGLLGRAFSGPPLSNFVWMEKLYRIGLNALVQQQNSTLQRIGQAVLVLVVPAFFYWQAFSGFPLASEILTKPHDFQFWMSLVMLTVCSLFYLIYLMVALTTLKGLAKGLVIVVTFVLTLEALYFFNTPILAKAIDQFSEKMLTAEEPTPNTTNPLSD